MQFTTRLLKSVEQRGADDVFLIGTQHLDLNDDQVKDKIERIAPKLMPAVTRDIADNGNAIAETIDDDLGNDAAGQVTTLLLAASLSRAVGGRIGLSESEIIEYLAAPNRKPDEFLKALQRLRKQAWYLHREEPRFFIKETENLSRQIERNAKEVPQPKIDQALINRLTGILQPVRRNAYQEVHVLPQLDALKLGGPRVTHRQIRILVATDAACEGLNLQPLGILINIDLALESHPAGAAHRPHRAVRSGTEKGGHAQPCQRADRG